MGRWGLFILFLALSWAPPVGAQSLAPVALTAQVMPSSIHQADHKQAFVLRITNNGKGVDLNQLEEVHARKIHLLVVDSALTDYHHVHPTPTPVAGEYQFSFVPQKKAYRLWVDITPKVTGEQTFLVVDFGDPEKTAPPVKTLSKESTMGGYTFRLNLTDPLVVGQPAMATVDVTDQAAKPVTTLQPVMGAFAHVVGFSEDLRTIAHIHPMGPEPKTPQERGGPTLSFHLEPKKAGFLKLFVQTRIGDKDFFAPLGVNVSPESLAVPEKGSKQHEGHHHE
jgi:hypothetical protein